MSRIQSSTWLPGGRACNDHGVGVVTESDYEILTGRAGVVRRDHGLIELAGAEAAEFLQGQVTNDVEALAEGQGCYAALLTHKGRIRTDMRVLRTPEGFLVDTERVGHPILLKTVQTYSVGRDVGATDVSESLIVLSVIGPEAEGAVGSDPGADEHSHTESGGARIVRTDVGLDLVVPAAEADDLIARLGIPEVAEDAAECVRIERGRPRLGIDIGGETIPQEADLNERAVSFTKGCYVGQETVARLHYKGKPNRHLRGLVLSEPAASGDAVVLGEREVGSVGSTAISPARGPIALALLRREAEPGAEVAVGASGARAEVVTLPFA